MAGPMPQRAGDAIALSLVSHTNAGKTTLARTLLGRDVGTVRDAPHVTEFADVFEMLRTESGEALLLWDTPGFGDSVRLARRLRQSDNPIGWLLTQVWDRFRDRALWASQQAVRNVRDEADVVLYLVNASESPQAAAYVAPEMEVLRWIGKPVVVLLNQLGAPGNTPAEEADVQRWRTHLAPHAQVRAVLPLDAFARCWVQEGVLLRTLAGVLEGPARARMQRLEAAWRARREATLEASAAALAASLARTAAQRVDVADAGGLGERLKRAGEVLAGTIGQAVGAGNARSGSPADAASRELAERWDAEVRASTHELMSLHGLGGEAHGEILQQLAGRTEVKLRLDEGRAAVWGGMVTGALAGLKADLASGGLTLGGGLLAGGLLGALGAAGVARGVNLVRGTQQSWAAWNTQALGQMLEAALLRYLAVAHFGRGRGDWRPTEIPPRWSEVVAEAVRAQGAALQDVWALRAPARPGAPGTAAPEAMAEGLQAALQPLVHALLREVLERLYPPSAG